MFFTENVDQLILVKMQDHMTSLVVFYDEVIYLLVIDTNAYYHEYINFKGLHHLPKYSRYKWTDVTTSEMKACPALVLYMGLVRLPWRAGMGFS